MRAALRAVILVVVTTTCADPGWDDPVTAAEVIKSLDIHVADPARPALADGNTPLIVHIETSGTEGRDRELQAVLTLSDGRWEFPDSNASKVKTVKLKDAVVDLSAFAGTTAGPLSVSATVKDFTITDFVELRAATPEDVFGDLTIEPAAGQALIADGASRLVIKLDTFGLAGRTPAVDATLRIANGTWVLPDPTSAMSKTIKLQQAAIEVAAIAGSTPGPLAVTATIKDLTRSFSVDLRPAKLEDVIESIVVTPPAGGAIADGATPIAVTVCATERQARIPSTTLELRVTDGKWVGASAADPKLLQVAFGPRCVDASLIPSTTPQTVAVTAKIGAFTRTALVATGFAPIDRAICSFAGTISNGAGTITVTAVLVPTAVGGKPSLGTRVTFAALVEPAMATGFFTNPVVLLETSDRVTGSFTTFGAPTQITFTATAAPGDHPPITCDPVVLTAPPPPPP